MPDDRVELTGCFWYAAQLAGCGFLVYVLMIAAMALIGLVWFLFG